MKAIAFTAILAFATLIPLARAQQPDAEAGAEAAAAEQDQPPADEPEAKAPAPKRSSKSSAEATAEAGAPEMKEVVRGFYFGLYAGLGVLPLEMDWAEAGKTRYYPGGDFGMRLGFDINHRISVQAAFFFNAFGGTDDTNDNDMLMLGGRLSLLVTLYHTQKLYLQSGVGFGVLWMDDALEIPYRRSMMLSVTALSLEYYTKLRHLSVGVDVEVHFLFSPFNLNPQVLPHVRYSF